MVCIILNMTFIDKPAGTGTQQWEVDALGAGSVQEEIADRERVLHLGSKNWGIIGVYMGLYGIFLGYFLGYMALYGIIWHYMALYGIIWHYMALYGIIWHYMALYGIIWH